MPIRQIPLLHRRYCLEGPALLWQPALRVRLFCPVGVRDEYVRSTRGVKIEKLRTAMWVARRWNQTSAVPKHIEKGLKHRQTHIES